MTLNRSPNLTPGSVNTVAPKGLTAEEKETWQQVYDQLQEVFKSNPDPEKVKLAARTKGKKVNEIFECTDEFLATLLIEFKMGAVTAKDA